jgi:tetratricopeptide (TPR) repeat protein
MSTHKIVRGVVTGALALAISAVAVPALAQSVKGRVFGKDNRPVSEAQVSITPVTNPKLEPQGGTTTSDGRFQIGGLQFGKWNVVITKGNFFFKVKEPVNLLPGSVFDIGDVTLEPMPSGASSSMAASKAEADERNKKNAEIEAKFKGGNADLDAGKFDDALAKFEAVAKDVPKCSPCSAKLGEVYLKKDDLANAEKYFKEAIDFDPNTVDAYKALATIYNTQQKFDDALKMSAKAKELGTSTGAAEDPTAVFNEGVVLWNAGKIPEAEAAFKKATELDPKNADAFYQLGVAQVSSGKVPDAVKSLEAYLKLAPTGKNADTAKALLASIKK